MSSETLQEMGGEDQQSPDHLSAPSSLTVPCPVGGLGASAGGLEASAAEGEALEGRRPAPDRGDAVARRVLERYAPAHVVVGHDYEVVRASSRTGKYLELAEGRPSTKVTDLAKRGLRSAVRSAVDDARRSQKLIVKRDLRVDSEGEMLVLDLIADPMSDDDVLVIFQDVTSLRRDVESDAEIDINDYSNEDRIGQLEDELDETRSKLRTTVEELETSNEELKSSNEEMMSMNEELQSTNEELATVNEELKNKVDQLARSNSDLQNFIESTQVPPSSSTRRCASGA